MSSIETGTRRRPQRAPAPVSALRRMASALPAWGLITTKNLQLRRRRGLMIAVVVLTLGPPVVILGFRLLFHALDPSKYGPAGTVGVFTGLLSSMAEFGFIIAAAFGTAAGSTDLTDGTFRNLVITGRSRVALFLARIPAGLAILLPLVALGFTAVCLVTTYESAPQPNYVVVNNITIPPYLDQAQFAHLLAEHPGAQTRDAFGPVPSKLPPGESEAGYDYGVYVSAEYQQLNPPVNEMVKTGLWLELMVGVGFMAGLGLGALMGERTISTVLMIVLEIIVTPILAVFRLPYFLDGQRLIVGVALSQLRPAYLDTSSPQPGGGGPLHSIFGGVVLRIPPMPTWAMISVIAGWIVGWSVIGAWRMSTRDT
jgi:hypothetical protein